jgi:hypothetical protein
MPTVYRASTVCSEAWGISPMEALDRLERETPYRCLEEDALVEVITTRPPAHSLEVTYVNPAKRNHRP